jgi:hypothetical protein
MTQRRQVKFLKVQAVDPPLGVHRIVSWLALSTGQRIVIDFRSLPFQIHRRRTTDATMQALFCRGNQDNKEWDRTGSVPLVHVRKLGSSFAQTVNHGWLFGLLPVCLERTVIR